MAAPHSFAAREDSTHAAESPLVLIGTPDKGKPTAPTRPLSEAEIQVARQKRIDLVLTGHPAFAREARVICAEIDRPISIARQRAEGNITLPDASDDCIASMQRQARDGAWVSLYATILDRGREGAADRWELLHELEDQLGAQAIHGSSAAAKALPQKITDAIGAGSDVVDLGNGKTLAITSGLALDTGFMSAYGNKGVGPDVPVVDPAKLKAVTEKCLSQQGGKKACYTAGYVQGNSAWRSDHPSPLPPVQAAVTDQPGAAQRR